MRPFDRLDTQEATFKAFVPPSPRESAHCNQKYKAISKKYDNKLVL